MIRASLSQHPLTHFSEVVSVYWGEHKQAQTLVMSTMIFYIYSTYIVPHILYLSNLVSCVRNVHVTCAYTSVAYATCMCQMY